MDNAEQHLWNSIQKIIENEEISIALSTQINEHIRRSKYNNAPPKYDDDFLCANYAMKYLQTHQDKLIEATLKEVESEIDNRFRRQNPDPWKDQNEEQLYFIVHEYDCSRVSFNLPPRPSLNVDQEAVVLHEGFYILVRILSINNDFLHACVCTCHVIDSDDTQPIQEREKFTVSKNQLLPLYNVNGVANKLDFPLNYPVLAMFPQTTTFYKGKITDCLKTTPDKYVIQFEDDIQDNIQVIGREIPIKYVIPNPE